MTLLNHYLNAVRFFLPRAQQDDIIRELEENLTSEMDERAELLGRPLTEQETADILRRYGHPMVVASRFAPRRQLVGPALFPIYVLALKLGLIASAAVTVVLTLVDVAMHGDPQRIFEGLMRYPGRALIVFAWTTLGFAIVELAGPSRWQMDWDPRRLPAWMSSGALVPSRLQTRVQAVVEAVFGVIALAWLLAIPARPWLAMGHLASVLQFAPAWRTWYLPLVFIVAVNAVVAIARAVRPDAFVALTGARMASHALQIVVAVGLLVAGRWVELQPQPDPTVLNGIANPPEFVRVLNLAIRIGIVSVIGITLVEIGRDAWRLWGRRATARTEAA